MLHLLPNPLPWYVVGPLMGLVVTGMYAIANRHLGVSGGFVQIVDGARGRPIQEWRLWFLGGMFVGAIALGILGSNPQAGLSYGRLGELLPLGILVPVLFFGALLIGFGSRWAGACTSGHGLTGCSVRSAGSYVAMGTFMASAVTVTMILHVVTGGKL